jgi:hypothetical protein
MPIPVTRYKCEYCQKKVYASKYRTLEHEKRCYYNPQTKSCGTCDNVGFDGGYIMSCPSCLITGKTVFAHGVTITNCKHWTEKTVQEEDF